MIMLLNPAGKKKSKRRKSFKRRGGWRCRFTKKCSRIKRRKSRKSRVRSTALGGALSFQAMPAVGLPSSSAGVEKKVLGYMGVPIAANGKRRRKARNYSSWLPAYRNSGIVAASTQAFSPSLILKTVPVVGGFLSARLVSGLLARQRFVPNFLKAGMGNIVLDLFSTGLVFAGSRFVIPRAAVPMLLGGGIYSATKAVYKYILPMLRFTPLKGLADYLTVGNAAGAVPLNGYEEYTGVADYDDNNAVNSYDDDDGGLDDFASVTDAELEDSE